MNKYKLAYVKRTCNSEVEATEKAVGFVCSFHCVFIANTVDYFLFWHRAVLLQNIVNTAEYTSSYSTTSHANI